MIYSPLTPANSLKRSPETSLGDTENLSTLRRAAKTEKDDPRQMSALKRLMPFNAEQAVNILSEFGPLVLMFIVNAMYGIAAGTWALIISTVVAIVAMLLVLRRLPIFPLIASTVTVVFGALTIITHDPMWVQIKVTIFNAMFAAFLFGGLYFKRNFFKYVFEKTFHYSEEGWDKFTWNFAWFFVFTAFANEAVRLGFKDERVYDILGLQMDGVGIWIAFKVALIMPLSGLYAYYLTRLMQRYRVPEPSETAGTITASKEQRPPHSATNGSRRVTVSAGERSWSAKSDIREINHG